MKATIRIVFGAFRKLRDRACELGQPGLTVWADAGEKAAAQVQSAVRNGSHAAEVDALTLEGELRQMLADGVVTPAETQRLRLVADRLHRVADRCHDVGEVVL